MAVSATGRSTRDRRLSTQDRVGSIRMVPTPVFAWDRTRAERSIGSTRQFALDRIDRLESLHARLPPLRKRSRQAHDSQTETRYRDAREHIEYRKTSKVDRKLKHGAQVRSGEDQTQIGYPSRRRGSLGCSAKAGYRRGVDGHSPGRSGSALSGSRWRCPLDLCADKIARSSSGDPGARAVRARTGRPAAGQIRLVRRSRLAQLRQAGNTIGTSFVRQRASRTDSP